MAAKTRFQKLLAGSAPTTQDLRNRRWIYIPYDRFTDRTGPLTEQPPADTGIVIVESTAKALRRPYHKKKLVLLISNMRHFALEQAARGVSVLYHFTPGSHGQGLLDLQRRRAVPHLTTTIPAERELRLDLAYAVQEGLALDQVTDTTWLSQTEDFTGVYGAWAPGKSYVMDRFYRRMRQKTGILMERGKPVGGKFSYDPDNRNPYKGEVPIPRPPLFAPDRLTEEVIDYVSGQYAHHFGSIANFFLPCTQADCDALWRFGLRDLLPYFGPFEDAMRDDEQQLFHSQTSPLINLARVLPLTLVQDVAAAAAEGSVPLPSAEGFIRQLLGWREFMRHLHEQTDGYRLLTTPSESRPRPQELSPDLPNAALLAAAYPALIPVSALSSRSEQSAIGTAPAPAAALPLQLKRGQRKRSAALLSPDTVAPAHILGSSKDLPPETSSLIGTTPDVPPPGQDPYAGARPSALGATLPLPAAYWGVKSGLHCLDTCVQQVIDHGWSHHITRLMVLANLANLCGFSPRELTDWFWFGYVDAYDWVVEPNVLGMATYADGGLTATKPYVSGAAYINRMSNFCGHCRYDPKKSLGEDSCPFTALYWTFLARNEAVLGRNFRMQMPYNTLRKKSPAELTQLRERADQAIAELQAAKRPAYD